ncbi:MAG TPA: two-component regulator propeller domain-containing protein [Tenuifilaceae bacterium]|nr:two-component regulator propeller domain-containing protein [Tenuifilaceae bacterium]
MSIIRKYGNVRRFIGSIIVAVSVLFNVDVCAQPYGLSTPVSFKNIGVEDGLTSSEVNALFQDKKGFIWIGTEDGLYRYDGYEMIAFKTIPNDSTSISSNEITCIISDTKDRLWIGTTNGLNLYNSENEKFTRFVHQVSQPNSIRNSHVLKLYPAKNGCVWVETLGGNLTFFDEKGVSTKHFKHQPSSQPYYRYHALYQDSDTSIWFGGRGLGLHRINPQNGVITPYSANPGRSDRKRDDDISLIFNHPRLGWYVAGLDGLYKFFPKDSSFVKIFGTTTYSVVADKKNNLWVGTGYGLALLPAGNGNPIFFRNDPDNPNSLANNSVKALLVDRNGNIWAGTKQGVSFFNVNGTKFRSIQRVQGSGSLLSSNKVTALMEDGKGNVWIGTADAGINVWNSKNQLISRFNTDKGNLTSDKVSCIYEDSKSDIWVGLWAGIGFNRIEKSNGRISHYAYQENSRKIDWYNSFYEDVNGDFWIGMWGGQGLYKFDRKTEKFRDDIYVNIDIPYNEEMTEIVEQDDYLYFVPVNHRRLYRYNKDNGKFYNLAHSLTGDSKFKFPPTRFFNPKVLNNQELVVASDIGVHLLSKNGVEQKSRLINNVQALTVSGDSSKIYVLTGSSLQVLSNSLKEISSCFLKTTFGAIVGLFVDNEDNVYVLSNNVLWFVDKNGNAKAVLKGDWGRVGAFSHDGKIYGFDRTRIYRLHNETLEQEYSFFNGFDSANFNIEKVIPKDCNSAICFTNAGTYQVYFNNGKAISVNFGGFKEFSQGEVSAALYTKRNSLVLSLNKNIFEFDISTGNYAKLNDFNGKALSSHLITKIVGEKNGTLWVGSSDEGLNRLSPNRDTIIHFKVDTENNAIAGNDVSALVFDRDSNLWIGTNKGISIYNHRSGKVSPLAVEVASQKVKSIVQDVYGFMWVGTDNGLIRFSPADNTYSVYNEADGLISTSFSNAAISRSDSTLILGTNNGIVLINPADFFAEEKDMPVYITSFSVMGKRVKSLFEPNEEVKLNYDDSYFSIGVSTLNFTFPLRKKFFYRLEGLDNSWREFEGNRVFFSKLKAGRYKFYVCSEPNVNVENLLTIKVNPPFWQSWWFRLTIALIIMGVVVGYLVAYINRLKIKQRSSEFEQKLLLSQMNPHFIYNSLSAIQNYMFANRPIEAGNYLSDFSRLMRLILENSRSKEILLSKELQSLRFYLELQKLRFSEKFDYEIVVPEDINGNIIYIAPMLIQPFVENSIEHGIQYKEGKGFISLTLRLEGGFAVFEIVDDGVGIEKSKEINSAKSELRHSQSTQITQERIELLSKRKQGKTSIEIIDRQVTEGVSGTRVIVKIPYRVEAESKLTRQRSNKHSKL